MKKKFIQEPVFETYCWFVWDCSEEELAKWIKRGWGIEIEVRGVLGKTVHLRDEKNDTDDWIVWVKETYFREIVHETSHLVFSLMRMKGIEVCFDTEDVFAHLQCFYVKKMIDAIERRDKDASKKRQTKNIGRTQKKA